MPVILLKEAKPGVSANRRMWFLCDCGRKETERRSKLLGGKITGCRQCRRSGEKK